MAAPTIKVLLCLSVFEAVHRRPDNLKAFALQFRFGSFQTHGYVLGIRLIPTRGPSAVQSQNPPL
jgi:hypothetical protein